VVTIVTTVTEQEAEIDEKCMFAVDAKQLSQYLTQMYGHLVNANTLKPFCHDYQHVGRVVLKNADDADEREHCRTTIIRRPPADQMPGWPIIRLPPAQHSRMPGQTPGCPCQCSTPGMDDASDRSVINH